MTPHDTLPAIPRPECRACGCRHEAHAHTDPEAMEREALRCLESRNALGAAIWRARASSTRNGRIVR